jgi:choline kinase
MKAVLLAAGLGTRISRYLGGNPKCTVSLGSETLIEYTIDLLQKGGINDIAIVVGYRSEVIKNLLSGKKITFFENPFFDVTGSIASLWFAESYINDDMLFMNADVFLSEKIFEQILQSKLDPVMFADESRIDVADYRFNYKNNVLAKYGKELPNSETTGEYIGVAKISSSFVPVFLQRLDKLIFLQRHSFWWEDVLYSLCSERPVYVEDCGKKFWAEVDYIEDYERIKRYLSEKRAK